MTFSKAETGVLIDASLYIRKMCFDPLDPQSMELCAEIDAFVSRLKTEAAPQLSDDEVRNSCIFLSNYMDSGDMKANPKVCQVLLFRLTEILRAHEEE